MSAGGLKDEAELITKARRKSELVAQVQERGTYGPERKRKTMLSKLLA